jgi:hypothetical protein
MALRTVLVSRAPARLQPRRVPPKGINEVLKSSDANHAASKPPWSRAAESASSDDSWVSDLDGEINSGVGAHRTALTRARGSTFVDCIPSNPGTYRKRSLEDRRFPSVSDAFTRAPILGGNSPARRTPKGAACAAAMHRRAVRTGCPGRGRSGIQCCAVAFNAGSRPGLRWKPSHRRCCGSRSSGEDELSSAGVGSWNVSTSRPRHEHRRWTRWARFGLRSSLMTPRCPRHGQPSIRRHRDHVGITTPAFRTTSPLWSSRESRTRGDPARDGAR